ncbi:glycosyltransferase [Paraburkholderia tagetis]|uniref:Glycosyltransferase n=1 Tax=Paraburkholderia tagetis TaxID=2913261 RepID=A0A9X1RVH5_9BURK|nr:glycosyltransferase [Paraburkholderia tagetis]MCG5075123.1 glycosyltransferase [Paraburkholderia tagetis]
MRIAQVAPLYERVPPQGYGATERIVHYLTEGLVERGHDVTLFASANSLTSARLVPCCPLPLWQDREVEDTLVHHVAELERVVDCAARFEAQMRPLLSRHAQSVEYFGEAGGSLRTDLLSHAEALLMPIAWDEPFGLVMIEALACGTPVIAYRRGAVPEVLEDGVSGYLASELDEAVRAVERLPALSRSRCRAEFERRFTAARMTGDYVHVYRTLLEQRHTAGPNAPLPSRDRDGRTS